jgi:predicted nucleotidyltransferase
MPSPGMTRPTVWLFGSCARGEPRQASDIDIAILPRDNLPLGFFGELQADIEESTIPYVSISSICGVPIRRLST